MKCKPSRWNNCAVVNLLQANLAFCTVTEFIESALESEMSSNLDDYERVTGNKHNSYKKKTLKTDSGEIESLCYKYTTAPLSRIGKKLETVLADNHAPKIIG